MVIKFMDLVDKELKCVRNLKKGIKLHPDHMFVLQTFLKKAWMYHDMPIISHNAFAAYSLHK